MGRQSTKIDLEEGEDEDVIAQKLFLTEDGASSKKKKSKKRQRDEDESDHIEQEKPEAEEESISSPQPKQEKKKKKKSTEDTSSTPKAKKPAKKKARQDDEAEEDEEEGDDKKKYQRLILFVGQIPFEATEKDIVKHFAEHGAGAVKVRLLTEKGTGKSRGMAFVDFETPQQLVTGLRVHRTRLLGRAINVERTVGGGGNNETRKEKLKQLREFQGSKVLKDVKEIVDNALSRSRGMLTHEDMDDLVVRSLCSLPRDAAKQVMDEVLESDIANARNKKAWILGCIKRYVSRLKTGEQFLTLGEEKAGIIEKRTEKSSTRGGASRGRGGRGGMGRTGDRPVSSAPRDDRGARRDSSSHSGNRQKFKRGGIGGA